MTTIRDLNTVESGARPRPRIALMQPPTLQATRSAIVTSVYHARELLSEASRALDELRVNHAFAHAPLDTVPSADVLRGHENTIQNATALIAGAVGTIKLVPAVSQPEKGLWRAAEWLERAVVAGKVAAMHGHYTAHYVVALADHDRRHFAKSLAIWARAAEAAVQETHRALAELAELMPDAYETANE